VSIIVIALFFWNYFSLNPHIGNAVTISLAAVCLAGITLAISVVSFFWTPKKHIFHITLAIYLLLSVTAATMVISTGNTSSIFVSLWIIACFFAGIFDVWGILPVIIAAGVYAAILYVDRVLTKTFLLEIIFSSLLPLIAGFIVWRSKSENDETDNDNKAFRSLANELSAVASKSEVVINAIGDGVVAIDSQGIIQLINPAAQNIIGWGKQDAIALSYKSVLKLINQRDEALEPANDPIQQALNSNQEIRTNNLSLMTNSGKKIMISLVVSPVGEIGSGVITVFHDITNEKAEEREQAEFISTASHEMRTPVASIEGYLGLALNPQTAQIDDRARDFILKAHASAEHLGFLFQDLLDVAKSDDGRMSNKPRVINLVIFVRDIVQGLKQKANDKGLQLIYKPMPDNSTERHIAPSYSVNLDNDHIREIVNNLV
jgi:PAS domain S-box-containing protein